MITVKRLVVPGMVCAAMAGAMVAFAQDDLDNLLKDLESDRGKPAAAETKKEPANVPAPAVADEVVEKKEETPASEEKKVEEPVAEVVPASAAEEKKPEETVAEAAPAAEAVAVKVEAKEEKKSIEAEAAVAAKPAEKGASEAEVASFLDDLARVPDDGKKAANATPAPAKAAVAVVVAKPADPDAELISDLMATESLRREAMDAQAKREVMAARDAMSGRDWDTAYRKYSLAFKHLSDRADSVEFRRECAQGMAEARYQAGRQAYRSGEMDLARQLAVEARTLRHPRAQALIEAVEGDTISVEEKDVSEIAHRRNDKDYKEDRNSIRRRLRRSAQYLAVSDLDKALEECELVIRFDPYNSEALELRRRI